MPDAKPEDDTPGPEKHHPLAQEDRPKIIWANRTLGDVAVESLNALRMANSPPTLFQYGRNLVRLREDESGVSVEPLAYESMRHHLDQAATFISARQNQEGKWRYLPCPPPKDFVYDLLAMPSWSAEVFPHLKGIIRCPVFAADGALITTPGYNTKTRLWYHPDPDLNIASIPENPTLEDRAWALQFLKDDLLADFPFAEQADRANALAFLLTFFVREMVTSSVPLALIEAPAAGTGKSLMAKCLTFPALGRIPPANPPQTNDDQWRKLITSLLIGLPSVIWLDNVSGTLRSAALETVLTGDVWQERLLTTNNVLTTRIYAVFIATANNLQLAGDLPRRIVWIGLDAKVENPEERDTTRFKHPDLVKWMKEHRSELARAALILVQAWIAEKQPLGPPLMGSFESWTEVLGGILQVAGVQGFLDNRKQKRRGADDDALQWLAVCEAWWKLYGNQVVGVKELFEIVAEAELLPWIMTSEKEAGRRQKFGRALKKVCNRCFGAFRIVEADQDNSKRGRYQLEVTSESASLPAAGSAVPQSGEEPTPRPRSKTPLQTGDDVDDPDQQAPSPMDGVAPDEDPMITLCHEWWYLFGGDEIVDVILASKTTKLGLTAASSPLEEQKQRCADLLKQMAGRDYDVFRVERAEDMTTSNGRLYSCYRLRVLEGETVPMTSKEQQRQTFSTPHIFTGEDFDLIVATLPSSNLPKGTKAPTQDG